MGIGKNQNSLINNTLANHANALDWLNSGAKLFGNISFLQHLLIMVMLPTPASDQRR